MHSSKHNILHVSGLSGDHGTQGKLQMTPFEANEWDVASSSGITVFKTEFGPMAVAISWSFQVVLMTGRDFFA